MSNSDQSNAVMNDCSYKFLSTDSNPLLEQFLDEWKDELYRKSTILRLNDDCFYHVFKFLPVLDLCATRHTCRRFRTISDYCFEKRSKSFRLEQYYVYGSSNNVMWLNDAKRLIQNFGQFITKLSIERINFNPSEDPSSLIPLLNRYCFKLKKLALVQINLTPATISQYELLFSNLHRLLLSGWKNDEAVGCLAHCGSLKKLKLINFNEIEGKFLTKRFASLECFTMINCKILNTDNIRDFLSKNEQLKKIRMTLCYFPMTNHIEGDVVIKLPILESLCLQSTNFTRILPMEHLPATLKSLEVHSDGLKNLQRTVQNNIEDLNIFFAGVISTNKFKPRLCELKNLKVLKLTYPRDLSAKFYQNLACELPVLSELHLIHCLTNIIDIKELVQRSTSLKKIVFLHYQPTYEPLTKTILLALVKARLQNGQNKETLLLFLSKKVLAKTYRDFEKNGIYNLFVEHTNVIKLQPWTMTKYHEHDIYLNEINSSEIVY